MQTGFKIDLDKGYTIQRNASFTICIIQFIVSSGYLHWGTLDIKCNIEQDIYMNSILLLVYYSYLQ